MAAVDYHLLVGDCNLGCIGNPPNFSNPGPQDLLPRRGAGPACSAQHESPGEGLQHHVHAQLMDLRPLTYPTFFEARSGGLCGGVAVAPFGGVFVRLLLCVLGLFVAFIFSFFVCWEMEKRINGFWNMTTCVPKKSQILPTYQDNQPAVTFRSSRAKGP